MIKFSNFPILLFFFPVILSAQRTYTPHSVLANGDWYKIGVTREGVYRVDATFLQGLTQVSNIPSAGIRLFGNGGGMLHESAGAIPIDDLFENAIQVEDGGDGIFNGNDYLLFYAPGPSQWQNDSLNQGFQYRKHVYTDTAFYYFTIGPQAGKRIQQGGGGVSNVMVNSYDARFVHERDLVNLIHSGKEWYGEHWTTNQPAPSLSVAWPGLLLHEPVRVRTTFASRNVGSAATFRTTLGAQQSSAVLVPAITGTFLDRYATAMESLYGFMPNGQTLQIAFSYQTTAQGATCWLNKVEVQGRRELHLYADTVLDFRDWRSVAPGSVATYEIGGGITGAVVWDVTHPLQPQKMHTQIQNGKLIFTNDASRLREYMAFTQAQTIRSVIPLGKVQNQDLHGSSGADYFILTPANFQIAAERLANFHRERYGYAVSVVNVEQVYQEFASGTPDPTAIRDWIKMYYDRAATNNAIRPKYLLLFGSGSFDPRQRTAGNYRFIPTYQSEQSLDPLSSYTSDDFFSLLDDGDDINIPNAPFTSDIAIGRMPARNLAEAEQMVNKIIRYHRPSGFGEWRNRVLFLADDGDQNLHFNDAEAITNAIENINPAFIPQKRYLDAYPVQGGAGGARYPALSEQLVSDMNNGALIFNYSGHGNHVRMADEAVLSADEVNRFRNPDRLPLIVTASCDFYPFDDPSKLALGAQVLTADSNGAIGLLTTSRLVFASSNRIIHEYFLRTALQPQGTQGSYLTLGEAVQKARNLSVVQGGQVLNTRKFVLLGDPAMQLAFPTHHIRITQVNGQPHGTQDTLLGSVTYTLEGIITDGNGNRVSDFDGTLVPLVYDRPRETNTRGNAAGSVVAGFKQRSAVLFKGNVSVREGRFSFRFKMPTDISFQPERGLISMYAYSTTHDASGADTGFVMQGNSQVLADKQGPQISLFLNDTLFRNGGMTHEYPVLLAKFYDTSGINTAGNSIGHDITLTLNNNARDTRVLNEYFVADLDSYTSGSLRYPLPQHDTGHHTLELKAWDGANQSATAKLDYIVVKEEKLAISKVLNFPNPFSDHTYFSFEHNQDGQPLEVNVYLFQDNGRLVKRIRQTVKTRGTRNVQVGWDGRDESGRKMQKGIYIYRLEIGVAPQKVIRAGKLILL